MRCVVLIALVAFQAVRPAAVAAEPCPGRPDALGTDRIVTLDVATTPRIGRKQFPVTLPLRDKELVLTFDDGPQPGTTPRVLDALKAECVRATFFLVGRNAAAHPDIVRREVAEGHSLGHHSYAHPLLDRLPLLRAAAEIDRGIAADRSALAGTREETATAPFFRFPGFAASPALLRLAEERGLIVFGADLWASDWRPLGPERELRLLLGRIAQARRGIVLMHDTKLQTALMLPALLRALKRRGYHIVHVVAAGSEASRAAPGRD